MLGYLIDNLNILKVTHEKHKQGGSERCPYFVWSRTVAKFLPDQSFFYVWSIIILADLLTMWGNVIFNYQTTLCSQSAGVLHAY